MIVTERDRRRQNEKEEEGGGKKNKGEGERNIMDKLLVAQIKRFR